MVRVGGVMDQSKLLSLSTNAPVKSCSPHCSHTSAGTFSNITTVSC